MFSLDPIGMDKLPQYHKYQPPPSCPTTVISVDFVALVESCDHQEVILVYGDLLRNMRVW